MNYKDKLPLQTQSGTSGLSIVAVWRNVYPDGSAGLARAMHPFNEGSASTISRVGEISSYKGNTVTGSPCFTV